MVCFDLRILLASLFPYTSTNGSDLDANLNIDAATGTDAACAHQEARGSTQMGGRHSKLKALRGKLGIAATNE